MSAPILDRYLAKAIRHGTLTVLRPDGSSSTIGQSTPGYPDIRIRLVDKATERQILMDPRIGAGEAYMDGRLIIEAGEIMDLAALLRMNNRWDHGGNIAPKGALKKLGGKLVTLIDGMNEAARAKRNIAHHYDIGNDLYRLFLDTDHMQYSCAYWPDDSMTLEQAQEAKLAHIAAKLRLDTPSAAPLRILDIGCGWGGMAIYLARKTGARVHGITLSEEQLALARERAEAAGVTDLVTFELVDYRALEARGERYDRIVSVGMFEHVGQAQFGQFFRTARALLAEDGVMLLHTIGRMGGPGATDLFTRKYIFPGGYIPALSETVAASEKVRLIAADVENLRLHYAKTLRQWYSRCVANKDAIIAMMDERFYRMWLFYLSGATAAFESGSMCNYQIQYIRDRHATPITRDYLADAEAALNG
ncbi:class I SAM-dependent methyltransferase [Novosphingobium colocasiae]|uniref:class I SAM-dependent methyltransferase n=1 Tax=Novosphingobium colocasiae TaxID=1256513 RepID=UPI0035B0611F